MTDKAWDTRPATRGVGRQTEPDNTDWRENTNWREHVKWGRWSMISPIRLSDADQDELVEMLQRIVPSRERGHGVETYVGFIRPEEARSAEEYEAVLFAERLMQFLHNKKLNDAYDFPLDQAIDIAIATLQEHGIKYEGYRETFLYWRADRSGWTQIPGSMAAAIRAKIRKMWDSMPGFYAAESEMIFRRLMAWQNMYPWRKCKSLFEISSANGFETNTPIWHAMNIFDWYEKIDDAARMIQSDYIDDSVEKLLIASVEGSYQIGRNCEALIKKPIEPHALHGRASTKKLSQGREQRNFEANFEARRRYAEWQHMANEIWRRHPTWSKTAVAGQIKKNNSNVTAKTETIAKKIIPPN